jgi:hypothetical protein
MALTNPPNKGGGPLNQSQQDEIQEIVDDIVETIPLKKLIDFADMDESDAEALRRAFEQYIRGKLSVIKTYDDLPEIMETMWERIRKNIDNGNGTKIINRKSHDVNIKGTCLALDITTPII